jgi:hypothetical protein
LQLKDGRARSMIRLASLSNIVGSLV